MSTPTLPRPTVPATPDEIRRAELAAFLRSRRERLTPQQMGLPLVGRRRTPGLRREEVAQLAGVGVTWYTWLEQGRDIRVSDQVLDAIARTLLLDPVERGHLFTLAGSNAPVNGKECAALPPAVELLLRKLEPYPACVQNGRYDLLAYNRAYRCLITDIDALAIDERNCMWLLFTHPRWREAVVDWEHAARRMVANFRALMAEHVGEPAWKAHLKRMRQASPEFTELWDRHEVKPVETVTKLLRSSAVGLLHLDHVSTWLGPRRDTRLMTYLPHDADTAAKLAHLIPAED